MRDLKIKEIIKNSGLDFEEVAHQLFPKNKFPVLALNRVSRGKAYLDSAQISKLSLMTGVSISSIFSGDSTGAEWKAVSKKGMHIFTNGDFRAELDTETWVTKVFHKGSMFHESIIHTSSIPLSEYIDKLDLILKTK